MGIYRNRPGAFKEVRTKMLRAAVPVLALALAFGAGISYGRHESGQVNTLPYVILIGVAAGGFGVYKGLNRQKLLFESYVLTVGDEYVQREQMNTPVVKIGRNEIREIRKSAHGHLTIIGSSKTDIIHVTDQIEDCTGLENELKAIAEIQLAPEKPEMKKIAWFMPLTGLMAMAVVYLSTNRYLVAGCGAVLIGGLAWSFYEVQKSRNVDRKTKRNSLWTLVVIVTVVAIIYSKLVD